jgi:hypothetical protein
VIDDDGGGIESAAVEADLNLTVAEVDGGFVATVGEAEEGGADGLHERVDVFVEEEFAVAKDAAGVVDEGDQLGLFASPLGAANPSCALPS